MKRLSGTSKVALAVAALLASLSLVSVRQGTALSTMAYLDSLRVEEDLHEAIREDLNSRVLYLESYGRVSEDAERRLGMRKPGASDVVTLPREEK
jgi:cell division protein FtsL